MNINCQMYSIFHTLWITITPNKYVKTWEPGRVSRHEGHSIAFWCWKAWVSMYVMPGNTAWYHTTWTFPTFQPSPLLSATVLCGNVTFPHAVRVDTEAQCESSIIIKPPQLWLTTPYMVNKKAIFDKGISQHFWLKSMKLSDNSIALSQHIICAVW